MLKPTRRNWKDTNLALIGSDLDKKIKEAASKSEPQWTGMGRSEKLRIWRIEQFIVKPWPEKKYGKFHTGDSYVVLNTFRPDPSSPKLKHDLHMWIGDESSQDEYGTAAYKMVEADDYLKGAATQHREVQRKESAKFLSYFENSVVYLEGGVESGFRHVEARKVEPRFYRVKGTKKAVVIAQVSVRRDSMNAGDAFILHAGDAKVWVWHGSECNPEEKVKAMEVARAFASRGNVVVLDQGVNDQESQATEFWSFMPSKVTTFGIFKRTVHVHEADGNDDKVKPYLPTLYVFKDGSGKVKKVKTAKVVGTKTSIPRIQRKYLQSDRAFIFDTGFHAHVWIGKSAGTSVRVMAVGQVQLYFQKYKRPILPVTLVKEGQESDTFNNFFYEDTSTPLCGCWGR